LLSTTLLKALSNSLLNGSPRHKTMHTDTPPRPARLALLAAGLLLGGAAQAIDFGPFSLHGFAKAEANRVSTVCTDCQVENGEARDRYWADEIVQGKSYGAGTTHVTLVQPYLGVKFDLPAGLKLQGLLSQRFRDGKEDFKGFWYDRTVALSHDDWGSLRLGAMTTRAWSVADYPYGTNVGVADVWGASGAGYGVLTRAARFTTRALDVAEGDLVLEATYDEGASGWHKNKPSFWELYAQFHRGDLVVDAMFQDTRNGTPSAFGHGVFTGLTPFPADDSKLGGSSQGIAMVMARYQVDAKLEVSGGLRGNRWSGAWAVITTPASASASGYDQWNNMFNVDWSPTHNACPCKGYPATSLDLMLGLRYRMGAWTASTGMVHLGAAATANPTERGQSNAATVNTIGLNYNLRNGLEVYGMAGIVQYARLGLAPLSMPSNSAFTNVDSRLKTRGNWYGAGAVYAF
jgi:predicted porin